jgi:probable F420-dependent oxidoreductase
MKLGVVFPKTEIGSDPAVIKAYAQTIEGLGYDYLLTYDHVLGANPDRPGGWQGPYTYKHTFHEPFVLFGYLAGLTQQIELVTGILILPQRQTVLVAKQAAQVDLLSGGRLRLGIGIGWNKVEYQGLNCNFTNRGKRVEEQIALLRELWTKPLVQFEGRYHTIPDAGINPLPVQRPIPIWFGGMADPVLRRTARLGDGWLPNGLPDERLKGLIERLHGYLEESGRDPKTFGIDGRISINNHPQADWANQVKKWRELGATHVAVNTMGAGLASPQAHIEALRKFKEIVTL